MKQPVLWIGLDGSITEAVRQSPKEGYIRLVGDPHDRINPKDFTHEKMLERMKFGPEGEVCVSIAGHEFRQSH